MPKVLPHEYAFNAFLLVFAVRIAATAGPLDPRALAFLSYAAIGILLIPWTAKNPSSRRWRTRLAWYPIAMGISFFSLSGAMQQLGVASADAMLARWDVALLGAPATHYLAAIEHPWLTEFMMAAYLFFFYYLVFGPLYFWLNDLVRLRNCFVGLFTLYAVGFLGYSLVPASGPLFDPALETLRGGYLTTWMLPVINAGSNEVDVFPSIHFAASLYLLIFDFRNRRKRFWLLLVPTIALWISTVYLRYHYVVDLIAGVAVAGLAIAALRAYERSQMAAELDREARQRWPSN